MVAKYTEYFSSAFTISDSVYGSIFYMTGLHGLHVIAESSSCSLFLLLESLWTLKLFPQVDSIFSIYYYHLLM
jgi:heme/copper-type cytochrome/quinol oxidase subunit 3